MNLGDGLLFELENGKPKLIILSRDVQKNPVKSSLRSRAGSVLGSRQLSCLEEAQVEQSVRQQAARSTEGRINLARKSINALESKHIKSKTSRTHSQPATATAAPKVKSNRYKQAGSAKVQTGLVQKKAGLKGGTDSVVCLTNDQLQQILKAVQTSSSGPTLVTDAPEESDVLNEDPKLESFLKRDRLEDVTQDDKCGEDVDQPREGGGKEMSVDKDSRSSGGLLHWMQERESDSRAAIRAKRAQWRRELSEQLAQKQRQSASLQVQNSTDTALTAPGSSIHQEQTAAVRSILQIGEVTSMEERLKEDRREEQRRRWLEELDRQREETSERRRREKFLQSQTEDHDHWASHFDSLQRRFPAVTAAPPSVSEPGWEPTSSLSLWEAASSCGVDSVVGASVDLSGRFPTRTSYLRSMTALLDPVQIEERERKRLKQLEQQRVIDAQVEERRLQKQKEAEMRKAEEEEEEGRLVLERAALQKQYEEERETQKEQQKANEDGVVQPELSCGRSHCDVTDLEPHARPAQTEVTSAERSEPMVSRPVSSYKDTAVQTDTDLTLLPGTEKKLDGAEASSRIQRPSHHPPTSTRLLKVKSGKENICAGAGGVDPYQPFARSERSKKDKKRPEWNTQRPSQRFVPASERYPVPLQRVRQESRLKRQAELMALQEKTRVTQEPRLSSNLPQRRSNKSDSRGPVFSATVSMERGRTPTLPSLRSDAQTSLSRPQLPVLEFVPYVRTDEVFNLDPLEPAHMPETRTEAHQAPPQDVPVQPEMLYNSYSHQKQEILRGLAQLRQGLLQKQRELESDLSPPRHHHDNSERVTSSLGMG
ncbi:coiled-coil domain-containing protein 66 isoform X2 [Synchiropus splendidus]|uniref:coiled-coil domain-containing protein 66 isoform X2 n=1 Tax=Synchiropus splendidus TaxID=270530 RepID=UPI00237E1342|nr:coiled-coil domain-containing protein 66 isoform X2 [Synchiropus splendidus]